MTAARARTWVEVSACAWAASIAVALLIAVAYGNAGLMDFVTALTAVAIAVGITAFIAWLTSMVAGPVVLFKLRNRPDTLGVWTSIVLPLSIAFALVCGIATPVKVENHAGCADQWAAAPLITVPLYLWADPGPGFPAYISQSESDLKELCRGGA